jgi:kynurenine formamidase
MRAVDLSLMLRTGMQVYPGDPEVAIDGALSVPIEGVAVARLGLNSHAGTHLDAPSHTIVGGRTVDQIPLEWLAGEARVLRVIDPRPSMALNTLDIVGGVPEHLPEIVCVATGWDQYSGTPMALAHPYLSAELAQILVNRGARVVGIDAFSPDRTETDPAVFTSSDDRSETAETVTEPAAFLPVHAVILGADGVIVENLTALASIPDVVQISLLPLRIEGGDGSPIRAVAWLES